MFLLLTHKKSPTIYKIQFLLTCLNADTHTRAIYTHTSTQRQVHKRVMLCKQGTNPDNFAHKVELNFSLQSKLSILGQHLAFTKAHCSYHLKCERTALSAFL